MKTKVTTKEETGTRIHVEREGNNARIILTREYIHSLRGRFRGKGLLKELMKEKQKAAEASTSVRAQIVALFPDP